MFQSFCCGTVSLRSGIAAAASQSQSLAREFPYARVWPEKNKTKKENIPATFSIDTLVIPFHRCGNLRQVKPTATQLGSRGARFETYKAVLLIAGLSHFLKSVWAVPSIVPGHVIPKVGARHVFKLQQLLFRWRGSQGDDGGPGVDLGHWESLFREKAQAAAGPRSSVAVPMLCHPLLNPVSLPGERGTWLQNWDQNESQRPDLTPTLESTGSGAMTREGLSPDQTNKLKSNCPTQPCYFVITPYNHSIGQTWMETHGIWNLGFKVQVSSFSVSKLSCPWATCLPSPGFNFLICEMETMVFPSECGCKNLGDQMNFIFWPHTLNVLSCYGFNNYPTQKKQS